MTPSEAAKVLTLAACYDGRIVGETDAVAWADLLANVSLDDALDAVRAHYSEEVRRVMPADVIRACVVDREPWLRR